MKIINLTQHPATAEQAAAGVVDLPANDLARAKTRLNFADVEEAKHCAYDANDLASLAALHDADAAMIGGAPYLMAPLQRELREMGITPLYSFSRRESEEQVQPDGSTRKIAVFRHLGFVEAVE